MSTAPLLDLSALPPPQVVEVIDYEVILAELKADLIARAPELASVLALESEPLVKLLEVCAYRETLVRARVNDAAVATLLAYASGSDLDQRGANLGVERLIITPADPTTVPPTAAVMESDADFRTRILLSLDSYTTAGSVLSYVYHARTASGEVKDVGVTSLVPGTVNVAVLSRIGTGAASQALINAVTSALNADDVRPLCDTVAVTSAVIVTYTVDARLEVPSDLATDLIVADAQAAVSAYVAEQHAMGRDVSRSALFACLHQPGVSRVYLNEPADHVAIAWNQAPWCTGITLTTSIAEP